MPNRGEIVNEMRKAELSEYPPERGTGRLLGWRQPVEFSGRDRDRIPDKWSPFGRISNAPANTIMTGYNGAHCNKTREPFTP